MKTSRVLFCLFAFASCALGIQSDVLAQQKKQVTKPALSEKAAEQFSWRSIGPANMSGRITALAVYEKDPTIWWAASASGGLLKTTNNGVSFEHQFDHEATVSIGDVQVSQSDPNIVWVGTGEANPRNSSSWGDGVYKSTDGGTTWKNMGLNKIFQTGRMVIHPTDPNIVYVGALGRLWGPNKERGLFKTTDGGKTWKKVLYVDEKTGVIDLQMHPTEPDTLLVATYERQRDGFDGNDPEKKFGPGAGIHRTTDGGKTFEKITAGLPSTNLGRIGLSWYRKDPKFVYAVVESEKIGGLPETYPYAGIRGENADSVGAKIISVTKKSGAEAGGLKADDIVLSVDGELIHSYADLQKSIRLSKADSEAKWIVSRDRKSVDLVIKYGKMPEPSARQRQRNATARVNPNSPFSASLGGQRENLQEQQGDKGHEYGGVYRSSDGGKTWERINSVNPRPMYYSQIRVDPSDNNYLYVLGTSLYRSKDGGKTFTSDGASSEVHVDHHSLWIDPRDGRHVILGNDGGLYVTQDRMKKWDHHNHIAIAQFYHVGVGPRRNYNVYGGLQDNGSWGGPSRVRDASGPRNGDWFRVGGGDGFICLVDPNDADQIYYESQNGSMGRTHLKTGERGFIRPRPPRGTSYRFNWKTPFILSPHNSKIHYSAGNHVFRSVSKGDGVKAISADITNTDKGAGSAISESPAEEGVIYVGTTDGALWMTKDGGKEWTALYSVKKETTDKKSDSKADPAKAGEQKGQGDRGRMMQMVMSRDKNKDGKITKDELTGKMAPMFDRLDKDKNGEITKDELAASKPKAEEKPADAKPKAGEDKKPKKMPPADAKKTGSKVADEKKPVKKTGAKPEKPPEEMTKDELKAKKRAERKKNKKKKPAKEKPPESQGRKSETTKENPPEDELSCDAQPQEKSEGKATEAVAEKGGGKNDEKADKKAKEAGEKSAKKKTTKKTDAKTEGEKKDDGKQATDKAAGKAGKKNAAPVDDKVSGRWVGNFFREGSTGNQNSFTLVLRLQPGNTLKGTFETSRSQGEVTEGKYDPKQKTATFVVETSRSNIDFTATIADKKMTGELDVNGSFQMQYEVSRTGDAGPEDASKKKDTGKALADLMPGPRWISSITASRTQRGRCYVTFDGHRSNDDGLYVFVSENYGKTWSSIKGNLTDKVGAARVIREDIRNPNVLYLGCEFGLWVSIDRGESWTKFKKDLPTVAVHEIAQHATSGEIVAGTHGRALWIANVTALRQLNKERMAEDAYLFEPADAIRWRSLNTRGSSGTRQFQGSNPPSGTQFYYSLGKAARTVELTVKTLEGVTIYETEGEKTAGLHSLNWTLSGTSSRTGRRTSASAGDYLVTLTVDGTDYKQRLSVEGDPDFPVRATTEEEEQFYEALLGEGEEEGSDADDYRID